MSRLVAPSLILLSLAISASPSRARTWLVLIDGSGDAPTIQAAIDTAVAFDTVLIGPGTYSESLTIASKALTLRSMEGRDQTTITGNPALLLAGSLDPLMAIGLTFTGSNGVDVNPSSADDDASFESCAFSGCTGTGALMHCNRGAEFLSCLFVGNGSHGAEGGCNNLKPTFGACEFRNNGEAGVIGFQSLTDCIIADNAWHGAMGGGGAGGTVSVTNCTISGNGGHGLFLGGDETFRATIVTHCEITGNDDYGIHVMGGPLISAGCDLTHSRISGNFGGLTSSFNGGYTNIADNEISGNSGLAAFIRGHISLLRCVIRNNGGGVYADNAGGVSDPAGRITLEESTFHANGSGLRADPSNFPFNPPARVTVLRSIVSGTLSGGVPPCSTPTLTVSVNCTDLFGNAGGDSVCVAAGSNNFALDPRYCDDQGGDLTLDANSPCAPDNSPQGCGLIGALPVGCGVLGIPQADAPGVSTLGLRVSPNPMRGQGLVEWFGDSPGALRLYDSLGRLLVHRDLSGTGARSLPWETFIGDLDLPAGVYHLQRFDGATFSGQGTRVLVLH